MKRLITGIVAHVDAGKTTLSEALLYAAGAIRRPGRVDTQDAFLDTDSRERARGITIFSKQAELTYGDTCITLLDTPGHVDFSAEMERTLSVLDAAILVISGADGVQGHTRTVWKLLEQYRVPVFLFVNKMDQPGTDREALMKNLREDLCDAVVDLSQPASEECLENIAVLDEALLENYLSTGEVPQEEIQRLIAERKLFPCWFGAALRFNGTEEFLRAFAGLARPKSTGKAFGARVYKITRDETGARLTHLKLTGGTLSPRFLLKYQVGEEEYEEKIHQLRLYSGDHFTPLQEAGAGMVCAVTGLTATFPGQGLGAEEGRVTPVLEPVLSYRVILPPETDERQMLPRFRQLQEELPELAFTWDETLRELTVRIMGEVQLEILASLIEERFGIAVSFGDGHIVYKETIKDTVEGVGHFEPLRHYAEVHLLLSPGERGSGLVFDTDLSEDILAKNWQRLVLTHLKEKVHKGVLTGSAITDMRITLINGRAHVKHTEGGDFRQATYRAVRQGLMQADSLLLEPWYRFRLTLPLSQVGRAMTDIESRFGKPDPPETAGDLAILTGIAPVATLRNYQKEVAAYTRGQGQLSLQYHAYLPCHDQEEVVAAFAYDPEADLRNPPGSVFCTHGSGFPVPWNEVWDYMHLESRETFGGRKEMADTVPEYEPPEAEQWIGTDEIDAIIARTFYANGRDRSLERKGVGRREYAKAPEAPVKRTFTPRERLPEYLLVDGYNIIFAWEELRALAQENVDAARERLLEIMGNYQGLRGCEVIVVFDAYRVQGHRTEWFDHQNIHVVFTQEAETADQYIERFSHENAKRYEITVATSDGLEQIIIRGSGSRLLSARDLREDIARLSGEMQETMGRKREDDRTFLLDHVSPEVAAHLKKVPE